MEQQAAGSNFAIETRDWKAQKPKKKKKKERNCGRKNWKRKKKMKSYANKSIYEKIR